MTGRNSQVSRILVLFDVLESSRTSFSTKRLNQCLEEKGFQASLRTTYRDLDALLAAGFPLIKTESEGDQNQAEWRLERNAKVGASLSLSARELFGLYLARGVLSPLKETPLYQDIELVFRRLEERIGSRQREYLDELSEQMAFDPGPKAGLGVDPEILTTLQSACAEGQCVRGVYSSVNSGSESVRNLGPHYIYYSKGGLYLVAEDLDVRVVKVFAIPRFKSAGMTDVSYTGLVTSPEEFFQGALSVYASGNVASVRIEFDAVIATYIQERRFHESQTVSQLPNGRISLTLQASETPELCAWILGFGPMARVVAPQSLAKRVAELAAKTAAQYGEQVAGLTTDKVAKASLSSAV